MCLPTPDDPGLQLRTAPRHYCPHWAAHWISGAHTVTPRAGGGPCRKHREFQPEVVAGLTDQHYFLRLRDRDRSIVPSLFSELRQANLAPPIDCLQVQLDGSQKEADSIADAQVERGDVHEQRFPVDPKALSNLAC